MNKTKGQNVHVILNTSIQAFMNRAISLGVTDLNELSQLIEDPRITSALQKAGELNPTKGKRITVEDIVQVLEQEAAVQLEHDLKHSKE